jgi:hypothetical protein
MHSASAQASFQASVEGNVPSALYDSDSQLAESSILLSEFQHAIGSDANCCSFGSGAASLVFKGPVHATAKRPESGPDRTDLGPDRGCRLRAFWMTQPLATEPVATGCVTCGISRDSTPKYAHFETILKRNGPELHVIWSK